MAREIKFRAWIPALEIMLDEIAIYNNGDIGCDIQHLTDKLPSNMVLDYEDSVVFNISKNIGEEMRAVLDVEIGGDWLFINEPHYLLSQYTGFKDREGKEIYEGDTFVTGSDKELYAVDSVQGCFVGVNATRQIYLLADFVVRFMKLTGNIYQQSKDDENTNDDRG